MASQIKFVVSVEKKNVKTYEYILNQEEDISKTIEALQKGNKTPEFPQNTTTSDEVVSIIFAQQTPV